MNSKPEEQQKIRREIPLHKETNKTQFHQIELEAHGK
jgi:hypothetical protein